jgi:hypothetical protein
MHECGAGESERLDTMKIGVYSMCYKNITPDFTRIRIWTSISHNNSLLWSLHPRVHRTQIPNRTNPSISTAP